MIGDMVRPPCVVNAANSSPIDRCQSSLPSLRERDDGRSHAERIDVSRLRIAGRRRPADAMRRHIALVDVELVLPRHLAGVGVETHHPLLQFGAAAGGVLHADAVAHHDGRRAAAIRRPPEEVFAVERPFLGQPCFGGSAVAIGASHLRPVAEQHAPRPLSLESRPKDENGRQENTALLQHDHFPASMDVFGALNR